MLFFLGLILFVMPIFLIMSARMLRNGESGHKPWSVVLQAILYIWATLCILSLVIIIARAITDM